MCCRGLEQSITYVNLVIYTSKLKVFTESHKESEMWIQKWSIHWKSKGKKILLRYFLDTPILIHKISTIFTRWYNCLFGAWIINWPHKKLTLAFTNNSSFVCALTVFADLYNFLTIWRSNALSVHTELCSLVLTVNCCKTEKQLTTVQSCSTFWSTAKFTVKYSLTRVTYLRFLDALFGTVYW